MSHIPGHPPSPSLNVSSRFNKYGVVQLDYKGNRTDLLIQAVNNLDIDTRTGNTIGFHIGITTFDEENLCVAYDLVDYQDHLNAEAEFVDLAKAKKILKKRTRIEEFKSNEIIAMLPYASKVLYKEIWQQTADYLDSPSGQFFYVTKGFKSSDEVVDFIRGNCKHSIIDLSKEKWTPSKATPIYTPSKQFDSKKLKRVFYK